jgi:hypothetical protein
MKPDEQEPQVEETAPRPQDVPDVEGHRRRHGPSEDVPRFSDDDDEPDVEGHRRRH